MSPSMYSIDVCTPFYKCVHLWGTSWSWICSKSILKQEGFYWASILTATLLVLHVSLPDQSLCHYSDLHSLPPAFTPLSIALPLIWVQCSNSGARLHGNRVMFKWGVDVSSNGWMLTGSDTSTLSTCLVQWRRLRTTENLSLFYLVLFVLNVKIRTSLHDPQERVIIKSEDKHLSLIST